MTVPTFGLQYIRVADQAVPVLGANLSVIGIIGPCSTADVEKFPADTPVLRYSNDTDLGDDLGADGYIMDAINGINAQLADYQVAAQLVIVRTEYGTDGDANLKLQQTIAKIMGNSTLGTGLFAFLKAPNMLYLTPRVILAPGYTGQMANSLDTLETATDGVGYIPNEEYTVTFAPGGGETNGATLILPTAHATADADGYIRDDNIVIDTYGAWMSVAPTATLPAADGPEITALPAQGTVVFSQNPGIGSTLTLNGSAVTFVSADPTGLEVLRGANLSESLANLLAFLNGSADPQISKCTYSLTAGTMTIVNDTSGEAGNSFTLATTITGASLSGATLTGGRDAEASANATLTATIALGANPIVASMTSVLNDLMGHAIVESPGTSEIGDKNWRNTINSKRIIPLSGGVKIIDPVSGSIVVRPFAPRVAGALIARDYSTGAPFHSAANQPIQGIVGPARTIAFNLMTGANEGQSLLAANLGILVRGLIGVETAISNGGFVFIGTDTCSDETLWKFYNQTRGRDYIELSMIPALRQYLGKRNVDKQTVMNILSTIENWLDLLTAKQHILGGKVEFKGSLNTADEIRLGHVVVGFKAEEPAPLTLITTMSARWRPAIDMMVSDLEQQLNMAA